MSVPNEFLSKLTPGERRKYDKLIAMPDAQMRQWLIDNANPKAWSAVMVHLIDRVAGYRTLIDELTSRPASNGVDTSDAAAERVALTVNVVQLQVLRTVAHLVTATSDDTENVLSMPHQTVSARFNELRRGGLIEYTGMTRRTRRGSPARLHRLTEDGHRRLAENADR